LRTVSVTHGGRGTANCFPWHFSLLLYVPTSLLLVSCSTKSHSSLPTLAITHASVIDATGAPPQPDTTVLIEHDHVALVGPSSRISLPANARTVDATGKFLIPGLVDSHVHLTAAGEPTGSRQFVIPLLIANGITTVRDMGGSVDLLKQLRKEISDGQLLGPQIFFSGPYLDGDPPNFQPSIVVKTSDQARQAVDQLISEGVDFIKVQSVLGRDPYFAIADEAKKKNIRFLGHVPDRVSAFEAATSEQASIEHLTGVLLSCSSQETELRAAQAAPPPPNETAQQAKSGQRAWLRKLLDTQSPQQTDSLIAAFLAHNTWHVPTFPALVHLGFLTPQNNLTGDPRMKFVPANERNIWREGTGSQLDGYTDADFAIREEIVRRSRAVVGQMQKAGIHIMAGTDTPAPNVFPGSSLHEDLAYLVQAGLPPIQALQAATKNPAEFLNQFATHGTIEPNKVADLVILDANPLDDIHNTQKIFAVILRGRLLDRPALDALLHSVEQHAQDTETN
jgi:imidazolonepropionase-like amidohydrolase